jgi:hypothetical protein
MISGDHLLGRVSVFFDHGHSPDPVGEFLASLDRVEHLETDLCLAGHGRPFRGVPAKIEANREMTLGQMERVRASLQAGPKSAFDVVADLLGDAYSPQMAAWGLQVTLSHLDHLAAVGEAGASLEGDQKLWELTGGGGSG